MEELLARLAALERENARLKARAAIENLAAEYQDLMLSGQMLRIADTLWSNDEDVRLEYTSSGIYEGQAALRYFYDKDAKPGHLDAYQLTTPHITISDDAISARGVWGMIGAESDVGELMPGSTRSPVQEKLLSSTDAEGRGYRAEWVWQRLEMELKNENGTWKIRALHIHELFRCPYDQSWVAWAKERQATDAYRTDELFTPDSATDAEKRPPEFNASFATSRHWQYDLDALPPYSLL